MTLLLLEALGALLILLLIVWWTMFSGRPKGELPPDAHTAGLPKPFRGCLRGGFVIFQTIFNNQISAKCNYQMRRQLTFFATHSGA